MGEARSYDSLNWHSRNGTLGYGRQAREQVSELIWKSFAAVREPIEIQEKIWPYATLYAPDRKNIQGVLQLASSQVRPDEILYARSYG